MCVQRQLFESIYSLIGWHACLLNWIWSLDTHTKFTWLSNWYCNTKSCTIFYVLIFVNWDKLQAVNLNLTAISSFLWDIWTGLIYYLCSVICDSFLLFSFLLLLYSCFCKLEFPSVWRFWSSYFPTIVLICCSWVEQWCL